MNEPSPTTSPIRTLFESGQLGQAFQLAAQTVQRDPGDFDAWCVLGHIKQFQGLWSEALQCAQHALNIRANDPEALLLFATVLGAMGQTDAAIARCDELLAIDPAHDGAKGAKAGFLERAGRLEEALSIVEGFGSDAPVGAEVVLVRARLREGKFEDALGAAEAALARGDIAPRQKYQLHMLRSRALDRLGRYDEAFKAGEEGNALALPEGAPSGAYAQLADAVIETFTPEAFASFPRNTSSRAAHVFISGFPRSGTTLVEQILDAHPGAVGVGEAKEIDVATRKLQALTGAFVGYPGCAAFAGEPVLGQIATAYEQAMAEHGFTGAPVLVNKNLQNLLHVGFIAQLFPKARFILTQRDQRDVAVSCFFGQFRAEAMPHLFRMDDIAGALEAADRLSAHWHKLLPEQTCVVRYEDLVRDHEAQSKRLVAFAGLGWDERCLRYYESGRTVMTLAYDQVSRPIYDSSIGRYANYESHLGRVGAMGVGG